MKSIAVDQLVEIVHGKCFAVNQPTVCEGVSINSRTIQPKQAFFAISGENFDGHDYARIAVEKGASCIVAERPIIDFPTEYNKEVILVDDTIVALGELAAWYRQQLSAKVIAITGSVGKTTTRQILYQILSGFFQCRQAQKNYNNHIGLPLAILSAEPEDEIVILELGTNHIGEIEYLTNIACPDMAVVTVVGAAHLEGFGSVGNILKEKASIAKGLNGKGTLYINGDQRDLVDYVRAEYDVRTVTFGTNSDCEVMGNDLKTSGHKGSLVIDDQVISVPMAGRANLMNVLTAWSVCRDLGIRLTDFRSAINGLEPVQMRLDILDIGSLRVLNDCYNANPVSMENALDCLNSMGAALNKRRIFIAGGMAELGLRSDELHIQLGRQAVLHRVDVLLACGDYADQILLGAAKSNDPPLMASFQSTEQLCDNLHKWIKPDDIVLVKGSRAAGLEKVVTTLTDEYRSQG